MQLSAHPLVLCLSLSLPTHSSLLHCSTSTFDGCAIAYAVTRHLTTVTQCRTMFATHYHGLCEDFQGNPSVALAHMVSRKPRGISNCWYYFSCEPLSSSRFQPARFPWLMLN